MPGPDCDRLGATEQDIQSAADLWGFKKSYWET